MEEFQMKKKSVDANRSKALEPIPFHLVFKGEINNEDAQAQVNNIITSLVAGWEQDYGYKAEDVKYQITNRSITHVYGGQIETVHYNLILTIADELTENN
jgi:hypothetical protein